MKGQPNISDASPRKTAEAIAAFEERFAGIKGRLINLAWQVRLSPAAEHQSRLAALAWRSARLALLADHRLHVFGLVSTILLYMSRVRDVPSSVCPTVLTRV